MRVTFILKNLSDAFFDGLGDGVPGLNNMSDADKLGYLFRKCRDLQVTHKIGNGSFRDRVDLNTIMRSQVQIAYKLEPRKGYKLATFDVNKA